MIIDGELVVFVENGLGVRDVTCGVVSVIKLIVHERVSSTFEPAESRS